MGRLVELVEQTLAEASRKSPLAEKIVAVIYGDQGSTALRPGMINWVLGKVGKIIPQENFEFEKNRISVSDSYADRMVIGMLAEVFPDDGVTIQVMSKEVKKVVRDVFTKYVRDAIRKGKLDPKTKTHEGNYYGWIFFTHDDEEVGNIHAKARKDIEKKLKAYLSVPVSELIRNAGYKR